MNLRDTGNEIGLACSRVLALSSCTLVGSLIVSGAVVVAGEFPSFEAPHRMNSDFPCWLSPKDKAIGEALIEKAGFIYCGREDELIPYDEEIGNGYKLARCYGWQLASARREVALEAVRDGAVFGKCLEVLLDIDFKEEVRMAKRVIRAAARQWAAAQPQFIQLALPIF